MEKEKTKMLYFMHIPWGWIKQRPHFIAEGLSAYYDITVVVRKEFRGAETINKSNINIKSLFRFPFERVPIIAKINSLLYRIQTRSLARNTDIIWLTSPLQIDNIPTFSDKTVVYDCMDDMIEFPISNQMKNAILQKERRLFENASFVFASSAYLKNKLIIRYGEREVFVVNNALRSLPSSQETVKIPSSLTFYFENKDRIKLVYIGTISCWFDFELLKLIVERFNFIDIYLFGPTEISIPQIEHLYYCKSIEHNLVFPVMKEADILIMPFIVNELIRSVNPVKLYEYVASGKPCIAPLYGESEKFNDYVYLYNSSMNCIDIISQLSSKSMKNKKDQNECRLFAMNNTWSYRIQQMIQLMHR